MEALGALIGQYLTSEELFGKTTRVAALLGTAQTLVKATE